MAVEPVKRFVHETYTVTRGQTAAAWTWRGPMNLTMEGHLLATSHGYLPAVWARGRGVAGRDASGEPLAYRARVFDVLEPEDFYASDKEAVEALVGMLRERAAESIPVHDYDREHTEGVTALRAWADSLDPDEVYSRLTPYPVRAVAPDSRHEGAVYDLREGERVFDYTSDGLQATGYLLETQEGWLPAVRLDSSRPAVVVPEEGPSWRRAAYFEFDMLPSRDVAEVALSGMLQKQVRRVWHRLGAPEADLAALQALVAWAGTLGAPAPVLEGPTGL